MRSRSGAANKAARKLKPAAPARPPAASLPTSRAQARSSRPALLALFAASGFAGLIYESIWTHYLKLFLGHAAYAQTLVLGIFMGGLALGSYLASRRARAGNLLLAYAATEAAIGVLGLLFHPLFVGATGFAHASALPALAGHPAAVEAFKWGLGALLILPQSVLLGMTFPLMTAGVLRAFPDRPGRSLALLYFTNSLGAAAGVLASGFYLIAAVGLPGTLGVAAVINLAVALAVFALFRAPAPESLSPAPAAAKRDRALFAFLGVALFTGASSFMYEVAWIRMLALVLGSSTHAFELMLSAFILGLALGGLFIQRRIDKLARPARALGYLQLLMGFFALCTLLVYGQSFAVMQKLVLGLPPTDQGYRLFTLASNGIALAVMLPATFCAGTTLPLITFYLLRRGHGEASIGQVYAANTVGAIAAVFFSTHVGLPLLGLQGLLMLGAGVDLLLGAALLLSAASAFTLRRVPLGLTACAALALLGFGLFVRLDPYKMASGVYRLGQLLNPALEKLVFHRDGKTATVSVIERPAVSSLAILTNGKADAMIYMARDKPASADEPTMVLLGALPPLLHPQARTAACIGFGAGLTTHTLLGDPRLERVDTIEIEQQMLRGAEHFRPRNERAFKDPRSHLVIDDAKTFFATQPAKYDLIVSEPSNPWVSGVAGLFSDEFYQLARRHLAEGGLFVQWLQLYDLDVPLAASVLRALEANFDDYAVYAATDHDLVIAARNGALVPPPDAAMMREPALDEALRHIGVRSLQDLEVRRVGTKRAWRGLTSALGAAINSDYAPVLDLGAERTRFLRSNGGALTRFQKQLLPSLEMLSGAPRQQATSITVSDFAGARRSLEAMWLRDTILARGPAPSTFVQSDELRLHALEVSSWLRGCYGRPFPLISVVRVSGALVAELSPQDLDPIWAALASTPCSKRLSPQEGEWLDFLQAVGQRDGARMAASAERILTDEPEIDSQSKRYLVAAALLGDLAQGKAAEARALFAQHEAALPLAGDLLLQTLVAQAR